MASHAAGTSGGSAHGTGVPLVHGPTQPARSSTQPKRNTAGPKPKPPARGKGKPKAKGKQPSVYHYGLRAGYTKNQLNSTGALIGNPTLQQAITAANAQAGAQFNPAINSLNTRLGGLPSWFDQYRAQTLAARGFSDAAAQPQIAAAQQFAQNTGQALGLSGQAGQMDQAAAAGRQALATLGSQSLQGINNANNNYFNSQYAQIQPQQIQAATQLNTQLGQARQQRAAAAQSALSTIRTQSQNANIANQTLGLNAAKANAAEADKAASRSVTVRGQNLAAKRAKGQQALTKRGQTLTHQDRQAAQQAAQQKAAQKQAQQQQVISRHVRHARQRISDLTTKPQTVTEDVRDKNGQIVYLPNGKPKTRTVQRPLSPSEVRVALKQEGYTPDEIQTAMNQIARSDRRHQRKAGNIGSSSTGGRPDTAGNATIGSSKQLR